MEIVKINPDKPGIRAIKKAVQILNDSGFVVAPTETRYGLLARADRTDIVKKLYDLKKRDYHLPCAIFVDSPEQIARLGQLSTVSLRIVERLLPGPLTLILNNRSELESPIVVEGKIGLRYSSSAVIMNILKEIDFPVTATSANLSGSKNFDTIEEIADIFGDDIELYLDSGPLHGLSSTVVECFGNKYKLLRVGAISAAMLENAFREVRA